MIACIFTTRLHAKCKRSYKHHFDYAQSFQLLLDSDLDEIAYTKQIIMRNLMASLAQYMVTGLR